MILYLGYASFVILKAVCVLCLVTYAAVIGLFLISGAATSFPMTVTASPRRSGPAGARRAARSQSSLAVLCSSAAPRRRSRFSRVKRRPARRPGDAARPARRTSAPSSNASWRSAPRMPLVVPTEGAKVLIVKFNDFQCPACSQSYLAYKPILAKYDGEQSRRRPNGHEGLSAQPELQSERLGR